MGRCGCSAVMFTPTKVLFCVGMDWSIRSDSGSVRRYPTTALARGLDANCMTPRDGHDAALAVLAILADEKANDRRIHNVRLVSVHVVARAFSDDHL